MTWSSPTHIITSNSDIRGVQSYDGGQSWGFNYTGHTANSMYRSIVHPTTGVVYAATASVHDMYQSTHLSDSSINGGTGSVLFSTNGGTTWQTMHNFGRVVTWVEADPTNSNRLYASVAHSTDGGIWVTNNASAGAASTWAKLATPPRTEGHAFNLRVLNDGTLVASYSGRRNSSGAFTASSGVFVSTNGGASWQDRSSSGMLYWTKDVVIDPHDPSQNTWYASVFSGWGGAPNGLGGLYKTTNRGVSWTRINSLDRVNSVTISPTNSNEAYLTTEVEGLWYTENLNAATPTFTQVAGYEFMQPMRVVYNPYDANEVWVTSFGGGMRVGYATATPAPGSVSLGQATYTVSETGGSLLVSVSRSAGSSGAVSVNYATANGTAIAGQDYTMASGVLNWANGETGAKTFSIPLTNDSLFENNETFSVALTNPTNGLTLGPNSTANVTVTSDDPQPLPGSVALAQATYTVSEESGSLVVSVSRTGGASGAASVNYATANGSATAGQDYTNTTGTLNWADGEGGSKTFSIPLTSDLLVESNETFTVALSGPTGGMTLGSPASATVTLTSDDVPAAPGVVQLAQAAYSVSEVAGSLVVSVTRTGGSAGAASVAYATANGSAIAGQDYTATNGTLTWADGDSSPKTFSIPLTNDAFYEGNEALTVTLSNATGASLGSPVTSTITLTSEDAPPTISFTAATLQVLESIGQAVVTVVRSGNTAGAVSVNYAAAAGSATAGSDFTPTSGTLSFADGESQKMFNVAILQDTLDEIAESINLTLSGLTGGAVLGANGTAILQILDDDDPPPPPNNFEFDSSQYDTREDYGWRSIYIQRNGDISQPGSVQFSTVNGTATAGSDYVAQSGTAEFAAGERTKKIDVRILNNEVLEPTEAFTVQLSSPTGGTLGTRASTTIQIADDEINSAGVIQFDRANFKTQEDWGYVNIYLSRTGGTVGAVSVQFAVTPGTAQPGSDYTPFSGTVTFAAGQKQATVRIYLTNDYTLESLETATMTISSPTGGATLGPQTTATLAITDDEVNSPGKLAFSSAKLKTQESWGYVRIYVDRTDGFIGAVSVSYSTTGGTAVPGVHYQPVSGTLNFADGQKQAWLDVPLIDNVTRGTTKTLEVRLTNPTGGAVLGSVSTTVISILDDERP
jgi:hypothetical protein